MNFPPKAREIIEHWPKVRKKNDVNVKLLLAVLVKRQPQTEVMKMEGLPL